MLDAYDLQVRTPQTLSNSQLQGPVGLGSDPLFRIRTDKGNISRWGVSQNQGYISLKRTVVFGSLS